MMLVLERFGMDPDLPEFQYKNWDGTPPFFYQDIPFRGGTRRVQFRLMGSNDWVAFYLQVP